MPYFLCSVLWQVLHVWHLEFNICLETGCLYSTIEGNCSGENEWLERSSCVSAWERDGITFIYWSCIRMHVFIVFILMLILHQVEMTGDYTPDLMALLSADIIISTPEKWDGISRNWHSRNYVKKVALSTFVYKCFRKLSIF